MTDPELRPGTQPALTQLKRMEGWITDPDIRAGIEAVLRTILNVGISLADLIPGVGEVISWIADACKVIARWLNIKLLDTSPDVPVYIAIGTEAVEFSTAGFFPSHLVETLLQLRADWSRMKRAWEKVKRSNPRQEA